MHDINDEVAHILLQIDQINTSLALNLRHAVTFRAHRTAADTTEALPELVSCNK